MPAKKAIETRIAEIFGRKKTVPHIIGESICCLKAFAGYCHRACSKKMGLAAIKVGQHFVLI